MKKKSILGIFDSGVGGFSVFKEIRKRTSADIIYFGDCARAPYGNRNEVEIVAFIQEILVALQAQGVTHFVSACNSMSVLTTEKLLEDVGIAKEKYIDMISAVKGINIDTSSKVLIVGTQATITSGVYQLILQEKNILFEVFIPCSLAGDIEKGNSSAIVASVKEIIEYACNLQATHILYACTHYPLVANLFEVQADNCGWTGKFIDPSHLVASNVEAWGLCGGGTSIFEASLETDVFKYYTALQEV